MSRIVSKRCVGIGLATAALAFAFDQLSKWFLLEMVLIPFRSPIEITPFFDLVMVWNRGISFGMFAGQNQPYVLMALSCAIIYILLDWLWKTPSPTAGAAIGAVIGGALGNVVDRFRYGAVADFFDFHIDTYHWPAFNIADSTIFIGVVILCLLSITKRC